MPATPLSDIPIWLSKQEAWLQRAVERICLGVQIDDALVRDAADELLKELRKEPLDKPVVILTTVYDTTLPGEFFRLAGICNVSGVNRLNSSAGVSFPKANVVIVYGNNGAGKSGYVRLLKAAAGRIPTSMLLPNVFASSGDPCQWQVILEDSEGKATTVQYERDSVDISHARSVQVFDEQLAQDYRISERELSYEPPVLRLFDDVICLLDRTGQHLEWRRNQLVPKLPTAPVHLRPAPAMAILTRLDRFKSEDLLVEALAFTEENATQLAELLKKAEAIGSPTVVELMRKRARTAGETLEKVKSYRDLLSLDAIAAVKALSEAVKEKSAALEIATQLLQETTKLPGIGSNPWRTLWEAARDYSATTAYPNENFPTERDDARCVLCQQELTDEARTRFERFETFIRGAANRALKESQTQLAKAMEGIPKASEVEATFGGIDQLEGFVAPADMLAGAKEAVLGRISHLLNPEVEPPVFDPLNEVGRLLVQFSKQLANDVALATGPEQAQQRQDLKNQIIELEAKKWLSEQVEAVVAEWNRLLEVKDLNAARTHCTTTDATMEKSRIYQAVVSDKVAAQFEVELAALKAGKLRVKIEKSKARKGKVLHKPALRQSTKNASPNDVLSEGEQRVLALAAFLADTTTVENRAPFVFDDPVSSLDHRYESSVATRLVQLGKTRQVVIFTHRLSFAYDVEQACKKAKLTCEKVGLHADTTSTGIQSEFPMDKDAKTLANTVVGNCQNLRKKIEGLPPDEVRQLLLPSFTSMRRAVERAVEKTLLNGIVQRFDKAIHADNDLRSLARITVEDCELLDRLMGTYSREIHDQADDLDDTPLDIDELEKDAKALSVWVEEFKKRPVTVAS